MKIDTNELISAAMAAVADPPASTENTSSARVREWPAPLEPEAFHGVAGEIVRAIEPHSEADAAGLLIHALVAAGNMAGRSPYFVVGGSEHRANLYAVIVGATASRKGQGKNDAFFVLRTADDQWMDERVQSGLSSGEGLIWAVRDPIEEKQPVKEKGRIVDYQSLIVDQGISDKRLLAIEPEFGGTLRVSERDGSTLSAQVRQGWDSGDLRVLTKTKSARATGAHVSIIGHITRDELGKYLGETEQANGFANRFLWVCNQRSKLLPDGGNLRGVDLSDLRGKLRAAVAFARTCGEVQRSAAAREVWHAVYPRLVGDRMGLFGAVTSRAEAQVVRLSMIYALLDRSNVVDTEHLNAALAVWTYCENSARFIFGDALGDGTADALLEALRARPEGMTRTDIMNHFGRNKKTEQVGRALALLAEHGLAHSGKESGAGRPAERWFAVSLGTKETKLTKEGGAGSGHGVA